MAAAQHRSKRDPARAGAPRAIVGFAGWAWWRLRPVNDNKPPLSVVLAGAVLIALAAMSLVYAVARWMF